MGHNRRSDTEKEELLERVEAKRHQGLSVAEACKAVNLSPATYYRWRNFYGLGIKPAIIKDWNELARSWECFIFGQVTPEIARDLRFDVARAVAGAFGVPSPPRLTLQRDRLAKFRDQLKLAFSAYDELDRETAGFLEEIAERDGYRKPFSTLFERLRPFLEQIGELIKGLDEEAIAYGEALGGPDHDPRIQRLVVGLAVIYQNHVGKPPRHTTDKETGGHLSEFNTFVEDVFEYFLGDQDLPPTAMREAMRHAAARLDWDDDIRDSD